MILELGKQPPLDAIAERAGVGIATLYRNFPNSQALLRAVALHVLDRAIEAGEEAAASGEDGLEALRRYLHAGIDIGLGVVNILHPLIDDPDWPERRAAAQALLDRLATDAGRDGGITEGITSTEIALAAIRFCRPLGIGIPFEEERAIAHRQLDVYLDGLTAGAKEPARSSI
jgi:AcrR family transcriptional regulator